MAAITLVEYFIDAFNTEFRKRVLGATPAAYAACSAEYLRGLQPRTLKLSRRNRHADPS